MNFFATWRWMLVSLLWTLFPATLWAALELTPAEVVYLQEHPQIEVAEMKTFFPFTFVKDTRVVGFNHDLYALISKKLGVRLQPVVFPSWSESLQSFMDKRVDAIANISYVKSRENYALFTKPYFEIPIMVFANRQTNLAYQDHNSLRGQRVGIVNHSFIESELKKIPGIQLFSYDTNEGPFNALMNNEVDYVVYNYSISMEMIRNQGLSNIKAVGEFRGELKTSEDLRLAVSKDQPLLLGLLNKALDAISDQEWDELYGVWLTGFERKFYGYQGKFSQQELDYLKQRPLHLCVDPNWLPLEALDDQGQHIGMSADYFRYLEDLLQTTFQLVPSQNWSQTLDLVRQRRCDLLPLAMQTPERNGYLSFTTPYLRMPLVVATRLEVPYIDTLQDLAGKTLGIPRDYATAELIRSKYPEVKVVDVANIQEGLEQVSRGQLDAYVGNVASVAYHIQNYYFGELKVAGRLSENWVLSIGVRNDDPQLLNIMEKAINLIPQTQKDAIYDKWMRVTLEPKVDYQLIWQILFGSLLIISAIVLWNRKISRINNLLRQAQAEIEQKNIALEQLASHDKLTGLLNRHKLDQHLEQEVQRCRRFGHPFSVCLLDMDYFKNLNDRYGHLTGDAVLTRLSKLLQEHTRATDWVGRWGGEEFLIITPETQLSGAKELAEQLRIIIAEHPFDQVGKITVSIGVAQFDVADNHLSLIKRVDDALYSAKNTGRNRVVAAP